jgi:hypothetical protein
LESGDIFEEPDGGGKNGRDDFFGEALSVGNHLKIAAGFGQSLDNIR